MQHVALLLSLAPVVAAAPAGAGNARGEKLEQAGQLLAEERLDEAERAIADLVAARPDDPMPAVLEADLRFRRGDYDGASSRLHALEAARGLPAGGRELLGLIDATRAATSGFAEARSPEGHFIVRYAPGRDEYLLPYAFNALEAARREIGQRDFGAREGGGDGALGDPVRVEIVPDVADLAKVSTLTEREIETSGTIAVCKFNKLVITSPRALVHGYPWLDTLAHEYTHFVVTRVSRNAAPIWLQEGLAKFEERRWRVPPGEAKEAGLTPAMEHLLASALAGLPEKKGGRARRLITFEEMYPSMAKLPSQEDTALAFAEVYTMIEYIHEKRGFAGLRTLLERLAGGEEDARAVAHVMGAPFEGVQRDWQAWLKGRKLRLHPGLQPESLRFAAVGRKGGKGARDKDDKDEADAGDVVEERARRHFRLGGMLRGKGRLLAAALEYEKARAIVGPGQLAIAVRLAHTDLALGDLDGAIAAATPAWELYPDGGGLAAVLGAAFWKKHDAGKAQPFLEAALRTNPFDPAPHCALAELYEQAKDARADRERKACAGLAE